MTKVFFQIFGKKMTFDTVSTEKEDILCEIYDNIQIDEIRLDPEYKHDFLRAKAENERANSYEWNVLKDLFGGFKG